MTIINSVTYRCDRCGEEKTESGEDIPLEDLHKAFKDWDSIKLVIGTRQSLPAHWCPICKNNLASYFKW